jgi:acyl carrier protein phosphodiesterase
MNWLAHIFLSENNIDFQIGNYLADPLKGKIWNEASIDIQKGIKLHKIIDTYTDSHHLFKKSKQRLGNQGLLKAVVIDLTYDYLLSKNWNLYSNIDIDIFLNNFYKKAKIQLTTLPIEASQPLKRLIDYEVLNKYKSLDDLNKALLKVDNRLSSRLAKRDKASYYFEKIDSNITDIESDFLEFFPQLCNKVKINLDKSKLTHWKY